MGRGQSTEAVSAGKCLKCKHVCGYANTLTPADKSWREQKAGELSSEPETTCGRECVNKAGFRGHARCFARVGAHRLCLWLPD